MSLNYIPMSTPNIASIRKELLVNIEDPIENRSLLDPDVDGDEETINNDTEGQKLMDPNAHDYTGADIYRASMMSETQYMNPADLYNINHDVTDWSTDDSNPSLLGKEDTTNQDNLLDTDTDSYNYTPHEVYGTVDYVSNHDEYYNESAMRAKERNALDDSEFGIPRLRKYPLNDQKHVKFAIRMFGHCKDPKDRAELAKRIFAKVKEFDMDVKIGKGNPLYEYAPKSLQESVISFDTEVPGIVSEEESEKLSAQEQRIKNLQIAARTANVLNFQPSLGKALGNLKEYEFLNYFYPDVKTTSFQIRMITSLGGMANYPEVWEKYNLRPPLCTDNTRPLTRPNTGFTYEEFDDIYVLSYNGFQNWFNVTIHDIAHIEYCLKLYSVMGMILLNPEFDNSMLDDYWMGVLADWYQHVQCCYDSLSYLTDMNSNEAFKLRQQLWDLCWNPNDNPDDESVVTSNMIGFASSMISQKFKTNLNESILFNTSDIYYNKDKFVSGETNLCFITGHSGSGKSTMARGMESDNIESYELDDLQCIADHFTLDNLKEYGDLIYSYFTGEGKEFYTTLEYLKNNNVPESEYEDKLFPGFVHYAMKYAKQHPRKKYVLNDVWLYREKWFKPEDFKDYAFYIKGTSMIISKIRAAKRDSQDSKTSIKKGLAFINMMSKNWKWSIIDEKSVTKFRKYFSDLEKKNKINEAGGELLDKNKCNEYVLSQLGIDSSDVYLLPDTMQYPILNQTSIRMAMDMIRDIKDPDDRKIYVKNLNRKYKEFGCTFSISVDHPYAQYADQNIIDHMTRILSEGDTVVDDQGTSDAGNPDEAPWYVRSDVNGNVGQNLLQNKDLGPNDKKNTTLNIDSTEPIIV